MRVLITGTSPMQCGRNNRYRYGNILNFYATALCELGHEVDHRVWVPGDDLTQYDVAIVGLVPFNSIAARHVYTVCDVIYRARSCGVGLLFAVDDHGFGKIQSAAKSLGKDVATRLFTTIKGRTDREWGETDGLPMIEACVWALAERPWPTTLIPAFRWGDHERLDQLPTQNKVFLDPTPVQLDDYATLPRAADGVPRRREWMLGTLSDQQLWLKSLQLDWPVTYLGSKPSGAEAVLKEPELVTKLGQMWGSLSFPQRHAGGGWYRCRFVYSATAGAVLYADPREVEGLGGPYLVTPRQVETATDAELFDLAVEQRRHFFAHSPSRDEFKTELEVVLKSALLRSVTPVTVPAVESAAESGDTGDETKTMNLLDTIVNIEIVKLDLGLEAEDELSGDLEDDDDLCEPETPHAVATEQVTRWYTLLDDLGKTINELEVRHDPTACVSCGLGVCTFVSVRDTVRQLIEVERARWSVAE